jgi:hypothetical protein
MKQKAKKRKPTVAELRKVNLIFARSTPRFLA